MASESTSQTEVCLQVLGTDIVISECQDLYTIYGFMRPSSDPEIIFKRTLNTPNTITESTFIYRFASWCRTFIYRCASWCRTRPPQSCYSESIPSNSWEVKQAMKKGQLLVQGKVKELMKDKENLKGQPDSLRGRFTHTLNTKGMWEDQGERLL